MIQQPVFREFAVDAQVHFGLGAPVAESYSVLRAARQRGFAEGYEMRKARGPQSKRVRGGEISKSWQVAWRAGLRSPVPPWRPRFPRALHESWARSSAHTERDAELVRDFGFWASVHGKALR